MVKQNLLKGTLAVFSDIFLVKLPGLPIIHTDLLSEITDPIQTYFLIKYRPFTDPVMYEIQT